MKICSQVINEYGGHAHHSSGPAVINVIKTSGGHHGGHSLGGHAGGYKVISLRVPNGGGHSHSHGNPWAWD